MVREIRLVQDFIAKFVNGNIQTEATLEDTSRPLSIKKGPVEILYQLIPYLMNLILMVVVAFATKGLAQCLGIVCI